MRKPSPWLRSLYRSSAEAGRNWGEGVSQWTGKTGHLPGGERAGCGGDFEVAAEERGGRGGANSLRKGAGRALPPHACAPRSSCPLAREVRCHSAPSTDGAHAGRGGAAPPSPRQPAPQGLRGAPRGDGRTPVSSMGGFGNPGPGRLSSPSPPPRRAGREGLGVLRRLRSGFSRPL